MVGGVTEGVVGILGGIGGVETVGGATLGGTTVVGFAEEGPTVGILGGVGIGDAGVEGGFDVEGGPAVGIDGI